MLLEFAKYFFNLIQEHYSDPFYSTVMQDVKCFVQKLIIFCCLGTDITFTMIASNIVRSSETQQYMYFIREQVMKF